MQGIRKRLVAIIIASTIMVSGCGYITEPALNAKTAYTVAKYGSLSIDTLLIAALTTYKTEQLSYLNKALSDGAMKVDIQNGLKVIRDKWEPVWKAFDDAKLIEDALKQALKVYEATEGRNAPSNADELVSLLLKLNTVRDSLTKIVSDMKGVRL